jgi:hypothetical protein
MNDDGTLPDRLRNMVRDPDAVGTHSEACWQWHDDCALLLAADRLAAAEAEADGEREAHRATARQLVETQMERIDAEREADEARARLTAQRDDLAARLSALTDAIGDLDALDVEALTLCPDEPLAITLRRIAAAVQPTDSHQFKPFPGESWCGVIGCAEDADHPVHDLAAAVQPPDPTPPPTLCPTCSSDDPRSVGDEGLPDIDAPIMCDNDFHRIADAVDGPT